MNEEEKEQLRKQFGDPPFYDNEDMYNMTCPLYQKEHRQPYGICLYRGEVCYRKEIEEPLYFECETYKEWADKMNIRKTFDKS